MISNLKIWVFFLNDDENSLKMKNLFLKWWTFKDNEPSQIMNLQKCKLPVPPIATILNRFSKNCVKPSLSCDVLVVLSNLTLT